MDKYSPEKDLIIKTRKPYTITKQRERWTDEEHNKFLEALKLYGRAWQRIEEHIGTKSAVQIRSHAQKFFSKLEKEALAKGIPTGRALDIDIPPPRPKRKPSNPYPRKTSVGAPLSQARQNEADFPTSISCTMPLDVEKNTPPEKAPIFDSSMNKNSMYTLETRKACTFREFIPSSTEVLVRDEPIENQRLRECDARESSDHDGGSSATSNLDNSHTSCQYTTGEMKDTDNFGTLPMNVFPAAQNYPIDVPVHVLNRNPGVSDPLLMLGMSADGQPNFNNENQDNASRSSIHQSFPYFPFAFNPLQNVQENHNSFLHVSSAFSSLVVSTLLQNPTVHAAASFAASFWPSNLKTSGDSLPWEMPAAPSMAAVAAATVAAATAWWAAHGLLPFCAPPVHPGFTGSPPPSTCPVQAPEISHHSHASAESGCTKLNAAMKAPGHEELLNSNKGGSRRQVDPSSCGSNAPSSSEVETDAFEKSRLGMDELMAPDTNHQFSEPSSRRCKTTSNVNESWKEVSEEGRLAFQALFSREVLPQSFLPHNLKNKENPTISIEEGRSTDTSLPLSLGSKAQESSSHEVGMEKDAFHRDGNNTNGEEGMVSMGLLLGRHKVCRMGFKPYKRCSFEAKDSRAIAPDCPNDESCSKRIRLGGGS